MEDEINKKMIIDKKTKIKVEKLRNQIDELRYRYHVENDPEVTDAMYEGLMDELRKIEEKNPEIITKESPTQRVAGVPLDKFTKVEHAQELKSLSDVFNREDIENWQERNLKILEKELGKRPDDIEYICELKIDGLHVLLTYQSGKLKVAATRGDAKIGEDVTQNVKTIMSVPLELKENVDLIVAGEVWMDKKHFDRLNKEREKNEEPLFANPRNAAAGTMRQLDSNIVAKRKLGMTTYTIHDVNNILNIEKQDKALKTLQKFGFKIDTNYIICKNIDQIIDFQKKWVGKKDSQPYWIDGIVIKINQKKYQDILGYTGKDVRWAVAFKFPAEQGITKIQDVYWQVGRTGALTPVALMQPVQLAGTTVTHATLHNFDEIQRLGVKIGDSVVVEKAGDIIPKVVRVLEKLRDNNEKTIVKPTKCPICKQQVQRREVIDKKQKISAAIFCLNNNCYAKQLKNIIHFVSKKAFNIDGMGKKIVEQLLNVGLIKNIADIFTLTVGDLEPLERFAPKSAENLVLAVNMAKKITLSRFIYSLGISHVGEETAIALSNEFKDIQNIITAKEEQLAKINDVGPQVAGAIIEYFKEEKNLKLIKDIFEHGVVILKNKENIAGKLKNITFVLTGTLPELSRDEAKEMIRQNGGEISSTVSKKTSFVLAGENPGSKIQKAKQLGVEIINEKQFKKMI